MPLHFSELVLFPLPFDRPSSSLVPTLPLIPNCLARSQPPPSRSHGRHYVPRDRSPHSHRGCSIPTSRLDFLSFAPRVSCPPASSLTLGGGELTTYQCSYPQLKLVSCIGLKAKHYQMSILILFL